MGIVLVEKSYADTYIWKCICRQYMEKVLILLLGGSIIFYEVNGSLEYLNINRANFS